MGRFRGGLGDSVSDELAVTEEGACAFEVSLAMV